MKDDGREMKMVRKGRGKGVKEERGERVREGCRKGRI